MKQGVLQLELENTLYNVHRVFDVDEDPSPVCSVADRVEAVWRSRTERHHKHQRSLLHSCSPTVPVRLFITRHTAACSFEPASTLCHSVTADAISFTGQQLNSLQSAIRRADSRRALSCPNPKRIQSAECRIEQFRRLSFTDDD
jgi:hypothetical protein